MRHETEAAPRIPYKLVIAAVVAIALIGGVVYGYASGMLGETLLSLLGP